MNVLVLCDRIPSSYQDGLTLRILHYVRRLCPQHRFDLVCFRTGVETDEVRTLFRHIWMFERPERRAGGALRGWVPESLYPYSHPLAAFLETELDPANYDVVWDAACCLAPHLPDRWKAVPYFGDLVDEMVLALWNRLKLARSAGEAARMFKYLVLNAWFERRYLGPAAMCTVVSEVDAGVLRRVAGHDRVVTIQNGVDTAYFHPGLETAPRADLVFEGSMAFGPNIDAAVFFVREVLPVIRRSVPSVRLVLVGRDPVPEVRALASDHVEVTGSVPDVRPYVAGSRVFVSPLRFGAGIKNKILQAWSMGKATVATSVSVSGLPAEDGVNLLVRDGVEALAGGVIELLRSEQRCRALGDAGRRLVEAHFSWDAKALEFERALQSARATGNGREAT